MENQSPEASIHVAWFREEGGEEGVHERNLFGAQWFLGVCPTLLKWLPDTNLQREDSGSVSTFASTKQGNFPGFFRFWSRGSNLAFLLSANWRCVFPELEYRHIKFYKHGNLEVI